MDKKIKGQVFCYGDNVDTDQIYPGRFVEYTDVADVVKYAMYGADPTFTQRFVSGDILIGGKNFGCGSSREHAAICLKEIGVGAVIADSFARIFYRNGINMGLPLLVCSQWVRKPEEGESIQIDVLEGKIYDSEKNCIGKIEAVSKYSMNILESEGIKNLIRKNVKK